MASSAQLSRIEELVEKLLLTTSTQVLPSSSVPPPSVPSQGLQLQEDLEALHRLVPRIKAVLSDAENREIQDESVKLWLKELEDVAYSADDVLDEYEYELLRAKVEAGIQAADGFTLLPPQKPKHEEVSDLMITPSILSDASFWGKIAQIRGRFEEISKQRDALHLRTGDGERLFPKTAGRPPSSHLPDAPKIYGRKGDLDKVIDWLIHSDECKNSNFSVLPIVGMGGLGKTTLVQHVYKDPKVCSHFQLMGWVCVSDDFTLKKLASKILESFTKRQCDLSELSVIHGQLIEVLEGKRFLLVLDDVWNEKHGLWQSLQAPLRYGVEGSAVIATTRSERVARLMKTTHFHHLNLLSVDDCRDVFLQSAFVGRDSNDHPDLMAVGYKIVQKCRGLPLAAKSLGGLLSYEDDVDKWEDILQSNIWDLGDQADEIIPALRLSYVHLPSYLKQCFLYASVFPKDFSFDKEELVLLWMAQGFLQSKGGKQLEDIGNDYFVQLLQRSFFQEDAKFFNEEGKRFVMHDLIHDLAQSISGHECFHIEEGKALQLCPKEVRHLSVFIKRTEEILEMQQAFHNHPTWRIRTLLCRSWVLPHLKLSEMMPSLEFLRALDLSHSSIMEVPDSISNLKHLRYLNLEGTEIEKLPESVCKLYHLQTLRLEGCVCVCGLPRGIGRLTSLRVLDSFMVGRRNTVARISNLEFCGIEELKDLVHLKGRLTIRNLQNVMNAEDVRLANLREKRNIKELFLYWSDERGCASADVQAQVLENLGAPNCLEELLMGGYGGLKFPTWMGDGPSVLSKLVRVRLLGCRWCTTLPPLGQLPCLKHLVIADLRKVEAVGHEFRGRLNHSVGFPALETLEFSVMSSWVTWEAVQQGDFPCLRSLQIYNCRQLKVMVPLYLLPALKVLSIYGCSKLKSIELTCGPSSSSVPSSSSSSSSSSSLLPSSMGPPPLREIRIAGCPRARFSQEDELLLLPSTLGVLEIEEDCPGLTGWCEGDGEPRGFLSAGVHTLVSTSDEESAFNVGRRNTQPDYESGEELCGIEELKDLVHLKGTLKICNLQNVMNAEDASLANMIEKRNIKELFLFWKDKRGCASADVQAQVLENLRPPNRLAVLEMTGYGGLKFPTWMGDDPTALSKLVGVKVFGFEWCTTLPPLGQLPCLKHLFIMGGRKVEAVGHEFRGRLNHSVGFPALETLQFSWMKGWVTWEAVQQGDFPCLRSLEIYNCRQLKVMVPLNLLPSLEVLNISGSSVLKSIELTCGPSSSSVSSSSSSSSSLPSSMGPPPLREIRISHCPSVRFSQEDVLPPTLRVLEIDEYCLGLTEWCVGDGGNRLAHIPNAKVRPTSWGHKRVSTSDQESD